MKRHYRIKEKEMFIDNEDIYNFLKRGKDIKNNEEQIAFDCTYKELCDRFRKDLGYNHYIALATLKEEVAKEQEFKYVVIIMPFDLEVDQDNHKFYTVQDDKEVGNFYIEV